MGWRSMAIVLTIGKSGKEVANYGNPDNYAYAAQRRPDIIFMRIEPGYFEDGDFNEC